MTFCSTVLCGNRLCDWNTKPLCARYLRSWSLDTGLEKSISTSSDPDHPGVGHVERVERPQQRRLARARRADDRGRRALRER